MRCTPFKFERLSCAPFEYELLSCTPFQYVLLRCTPFEYVLLICVSFEYVVVMWDVGGMQVNTIVASRDWTSTLKYAQRTLAPKRDQNCVWKKVMLHIEDQVYQTTLIESLHFLGVLAGFF